MPVYTATIFGTARGNAHIARYNFSDGNTLGEFDSGTADLIIDRLTNVYDALALNLDAEWSTETISVVDARETGLLEQEFTRFGALSGDAFPPFIVATVRFLRPGPAFRHGYKRFSGVPETYFNDGAFLSGFLTALETFIVGMLLPIGSTQGTFQYCQITKFANGQPLLIDDWLVAPFQAGVVNGLGTQNTRKD